MYCVTKGSAPPSYRGAANCGACTAEEYCTNTSPGDDWVWDAATGTHRPPTPEDQLAAAKARAHDLRRARRTEAELAGFTFSGRPLDSDRDSILRIANAAASAISAILTQQPWATAWRCADEHDLPLDAAGMLGLQAALAQHGQACHTTSTTIGAEIEAAETMEQVTAIAEAIPTDPRWPA